MPVEFFLKILHRCYLMIINSNNSMSSFGLLVFFVAARDKSETNPIHLDALISQRSCIYVHGVDDVQTGFPGYSAAVRLPRLHNTAHILKLGAYTEHRYRHACIVYPYYKLAYAHHTLTLQCARFLLCLWQRSWCVKCQAKMSAVIAYTVWVRSDKATILMSQGERLLACGKGQHGSLHFISR